MSDRVSEVVALMHRYPVVARLFRGEELFSNPEKSPRLKTRATNSASATQPHSLRPSTKRASPICDVWLPEHAADREAGLALPIAPGLMPAGNKSCCRKADTLASP
jgi:hypothetical protein